MYKVFTMEKNKTQKHVVIIWRKIIFVDSKIGSCKAKPSKDLLELYNNMKKQIYFNI